MPAPQQLLKAQLQEIAWGDNQEVREVGEAMSVQFNPESLKLGYSNQSAGGNQRGGSATQFLGQGSTKLSFDLWFDVTAASPNRPAAGETDVRVMTAKVVSFIRPRNSGSTDEFIPPGVRFLWGTFLFEGIVDSINESLEYFSENGVPLRAKLGLSLSKQDLNFQFNKHTGSGPDGAGTPGTSPITPAGEGDSLQSMAARRGQQDRWQDTARQEDVDNPRRLPAGFGLPGGR